MQQDYSLWEQRLSGVPVPIFDEPQAGYYRHRKANQPVVIWHQDDVWYALMGGKPVNAHSVWFAVCENPIPYDLYESVMAGNAWPDTPPEAETLEEDEEIPQDEHSLLNEALDREQSAIRKYFANGRQVASQEEADTIANWIGRLKILEEKAETTRVRLKKPHDEAAKEVQAKWKPTVDKASNLIKGLKQAIETWALEQARQLRLAQEAELKRVREAQEAEIARQKELDPDGLLFGAEPSEQADKYAARTIPAKISVTAGTTARKVSVRTATEIVLTDIEAAIAHYRTDPRLKAALQQMARDDYRMRKTVAAGHKLETTEKVA